MFYKIKHASSETFRSLSVHNYRLYYVGQGISLTGTWVQSIAQTWLVLELTHSGTDVGLLAACQFLPILFFGPLGGVVADRFPKRRLLYATQSSAMLLALILAILVYTHTVQLWMVYLLAGALGFVQVVDNPTRQTFITELVGPERLINAITLNSTEVNLARIVGPTIAGALIASVGMAPCFFINAGSYVAVLVCLYLMDARKLMPAKRTKRLRGELRRGFAYIARTPVLRQTLLMLGIIGTFSFEFQVVLPLLASRTFHGSATLYAMFWACMSAGAVVGGLLAAGQLKRRPGALPKAAAGFGLLLLATAFAPTSQITALLLIGVGFQSILFTSLANTTLQLSSDPTMRGRVMALWSVAWLGSTPVGGPLVGYLSDLTNPRAGLVIGGVAAIVAAAYGLMAHRRTTKATALAVPASQ